MAYEWDEGKRQANIIKHEVDFLVAEDFDWETAIETIDDRNDYGEERWVALSFIGNRLHVLIYTLRSENIRIISLRNATKREKEYYETKA